MGAVAILHLEDDPQDCQLVAAMLAEAGLEAEIHCVPSGEAFKASLAAHLPDLIISDFSMPAYDGLRALEYVRENHSDLPFIFFSGTLGEETAVTSLRDGATDYVLKQRPGRLVASVRRALAEAAARRQRSAAEEQLREQAALLDEARDAICLQDLEQRILFWNRSAERLYGWTREEALGRDANQLLIQDAVALAACQHLIRRGEWYGELQQVTRAGRTLTVESRWTLIRGPDGQPKSILTINTDISEKKDMEAQYLRAQRLESVGLLAGGIAHDLNNVLAPILMSAELLLTEQNPTDIRSLLESVATSARRGSDLIRQILAFGRGADGERIPLDLRQVLKEVVSLISSTFPRGIEIRHTLPRDLPQVLGNATQIHQVLLNLCVNARDAMPGGGLLTLETGVVDFENRLTSLRSEPLTGRYVQMKIADTGSGISEVLLPKIFDPFFSTKDAAKGTGLGLSSVIGIIRGHGGSLDLETFPGRGTTFTCYFPALHHSTTEGAAPQIPVQPRRGEGEGILLVDDEDLILEVTRKALVAAGYRICTARDGAEALFVFLAKPKEIDLVVTDLMMPVMDGPKLIGELHRIAPQLPIIAVSGLLASYDPGSLAVQAILAKPFSAADLLRAVGEVLARKSRA